MMKNSLFICALFAAAPIVFAAPKGATKAPQSLAGSLVVVNMQGAEASFVEDGDSPSGWKTCNATSFVLQFPVGGGNSFSYQLYESTPESPWPPVKVSYNPSSSIITIIGNDMHLELRLSFADAGSGRADMEWADEGGIWYVRSASFTLSPSNATTSLLFMPEIETNDEAPAADYASELTALLSELKNRKYATNVERLYQKRLIALLSQIRDGAHIDTVLPNANGTTALHNACGLSHVEIVRWLVEHGADLNALTAKGATVDVCVGGPNAKAILGILRRARASK